MAVTNAWETREVALPNSLQGYNTALTRLFKLDYDKYAKVALNDLYSAASFLSGAPLGSKCRWDWDWDWNWDCRLDESTV
jgi:hypothetical protein